MEALANAKAKDEVAVAAAFVFGGNRRLLPNLLLLPSSTEFVYSSSFMITICFDYFNERLSSLICYAGIYLGISYASGVSEVVDAPLKFIFLRCFENLTSDWFEDARKFR